MSRTTMGIAFVTLTTVVGLGCNDSTDPPFALSAGTVASPIEAADPAGSDNGKTTVDSPTTADRVDLTHLEGDEFRNGLRNNLRDLRLELDRIRAATKVETAGRSGQQQTAWAHRLATLGQRLDDLELRLTTLYRADRELTAEERAKVMGEWLLLRDDVATTGAEAARGAADPP